MTRALAEDGPGTAWELDFHPCADDIDWELVHRLWASRTLVELPRIAEMCAVASRQSPWHWQRAARNYTDNGVNRWPPTAEVLREVVHGDAPAPVQPLTHPSVLPPPDVPGDGQRLDRWYEGTIYRWGMKTGRITVTGEPQPRVAGASAKRGRGPAPGRRLRRPAGDGS